MSVPRRGARPIDQDVKAALDQLEPAAWQRLLRLARAGKQALALAGISVAHDEHEQMLHDAITDTMALVVRWNRQKKMEWHLYRVIVRRVSNELRRAGKRPHVSYEALVDGQASGEAATARADHDSDAETSLSRAQVTQRLYRAAREAAAGDRDVNALLDAYEARVWGRRAVMARTGMTLAEFVNARRRLDRLLAALPEELREAALAVMREGAVPQMSGTTRETND